MATAETNPPGGPGGLGDELKQDAQRLGGVAGDRLSSEAEAHKGEIADQARSVSSALEKAAGGQDTPDWFRSSLQQGAETLERLAESVENKNPRELLDELNGLGRDHPGAFLGACAAAGFAIARVFKAGTSQVAAPSGPSAWSSQPASPPASPLPLSEAWGGAPAPSAAGVSFAPQTEAELQGGAQPSTLTALQGAM